jgi:uncharacterized protein (TIGR03435 family)
MINGTGGRVVVDRTNLPGRFEFTLRFARPGMTPTPTLSIAAPSPSPDDPPEIFTALQEQLGLKLEAARAPVDTLVIDHIERPTED